MASRRTSKNNRKNSGFQSFMTVLCTLVLVAGGMFFLNEKINNDHIRQTSENLSERFREAQAAQEDAGEESQDELVPLRIAQTKSAVPTVKKGEKRAFNGFMALSNQVEEPAVIAQPVVEAMPVVDDMPLVVDTPREEELPEGAAPDGEFQPIFSEFYAENNDLIGWIQIANSVDEPLLYRDNEFYMNHDFYGKKSNAGAIFLDARNAADFSDSAMLVYGHNMRSGAMFGDLDFFRDEAYFKKYPVFSMQSAWETKPREYVIISLFDASMNKKDSSYIRIVRTKFDSDVEKEEFIAEMRERSIHNVPVEADAGDQLLTLVTCSYSQSNGRFLVFARELREGESREQIIADLKDTKL